MSTTDVRISYFGFLKKSMGSKISLWLIGFWLLVGFGSGLLNTNVPLYCKLNQQHFFPAFHQWACSKLNITKPYPFNVLNWRTFPIENTVWCPIPYQPTDQDLNNSLLKPFSAAAWQTHHYLGTDNLGRDVASGLIQGASTAIQIGFGVMLMVGLLGILIGAVAGYFGNDSIRLQTLTFVKASAFMAVLTGCFVVFYQTNFRFQNAWTIISLCALWLLFFIGFYLLSKKITKSRYEFLFPLDLWVMKLIEVIQSIPRLLLVLFFLTVFRPSVWVLIVIIGGLGWTGIAKLTRAEVLKIKTLPFVTFAKMIGSTDWSIIRKHILPNAIFPALISLSFSVSSAILAEASLSFLGIGLSLNSITWGGMLAVGKEHQSAWWLILFPGICIFLVIYCLNILGERTQEYFNPKL